MAVTSRKDTKFYYKDINNRFNRTQKSSDSEFLTLINREMSRFWKIFTNFAELNMSIGLSVGNGITAGTRTR